MSGFNKANLIKGGAGNFLRINKDGSVEVDLLSLTSGIKSSSVSMAISSVTPLPGTIMPDRKSIVVYNSLSGNLYLGGSDVTNLNGLPLDEATYITIDLGPIQLYGYATVSGEVRILELA